MKGTFVPVLTRRYPSCPYVHVYGWLSDAESGSYSVELVCWYPCSCISMGFVLRTKLHNYTVAKDTHLTFATGDQRWAKRMEHKKLIMPCLALETLPVCYKNNSWWAASAFQRPKCLWNKKSQIIWQNTIKSCGVMTLNLLTRDVCLGMKTMSQKRSKLKCLAGNGNYLSLVYNGNKYSKHEKLVQQNSVCWGI